MYTTGDGTGGVIAATIASGVYAYAAVPQQIFWSVPFPGSDTVGINDTFIRNYKDQQMLALIDITVNPWVDASTNADHLVVNLVPVVNTAVTGIYQFDRTTWTPVNSTGRDGYEIRVYPEAVGGALVHRQLCLPLPMIMRTEAGGPMIVTGKQQY